MSQLLRFENIELQGPPLLKQRKNFSLVLCLNADDSLTQKKNKLTFAKSVLQI